MASIINAIRKVFGSGDDAVSVAPGSKNVANYWSQVGNKKFYVPVTAAELEKLNSLGKQEKQQYFRELLKEKDPQQYKAMISAENSSKNVANYWSEVGNKKFYVPVTATELEKLNSLGKQEKQQYFRELLKEKDPQQYKAMISAENSSKNVANYWSEVGNKKFYVPVTAAELEKLNSLGKQEKQQYFRELLKEKEPQQYKALINAEKGLAVVESMQANIQSRFEMILDEQRSQEQAATLGVHR